MSTARIAADAVRDACLDQIAHFEAKYLEDVEACIQRRMTMPVRRGVWPFRHDHYRTRAEAEASINDGDMYTIPARISIKWRYENSIEARKTLLRSAETALSDAGDKTLTLDDKEMGWLGLGEVADV